MTCAGTATPAQWDELFASNARAPFFLAQAAAPHLAAAQGCIVNLVDIYAERPLQRHTLYAMAKAALLMLTQSLAQELAPAVRVNAVAPGAVLWPESGKAAAEQQALLARTPLARAGTPGDVADAVHWLVCGARYTTGQVLRVDGRRLSDGFAEPRVLTQNRAHARDVGFAVLTHLLGAFDEQGEVEAHALNEAGVVRGPLVGAAPVGGPSPGHERRPDTDGHRDRLGAIPVLGEAVRDRQKIGGLDGVARDDAFDGRAARGEPDRLEGRGEDARWHLHEPLAVVREDGVDHLKLGRERWVSVGEGW